MLANRRLKAFRLYNMLIDIPALEVLANPRLESTHSNGFIGLEKQLVEEIVDPFDERGI